MSAVKNQMRTALGRVRHLGSAKEGVQHWWAQRLTAVALVPLTIWFVASVAYLAGADHAAFAGWIARPLNALLMIVLLGAGFHHAQLGLQVVIEDYVHGEAAKLVSLIVVKFAALLLALAGIFAVLKLAFGA
ncbi:MAG: succinate dehydrogenase, hydrophobic membrane anchor protein [Alphaproteobacteria bacterium]